VVIISTDLTGDLAIADIVKSSEARSRYSSHTMVWYKEMLLPAHKDNVLVPVIVCLRIIMVVMWAGHMVVLVISVVYI